MCLLLKITDIVLHGIRASNGGCSGFPGKGAIVVAFKFGSRTDTALKLSGINKRNRRKTEYVWS